MEDTYLAKVVTQSQPYKLEDGSNSWIADVVYKKDDFYYTRKILSPSIKHGPLIIGEEIIVTYDKDDEIANEEMVKTYKDPNYYKKMIENSKRQKEIEEKLEDEEVPVLSSIIKIFNIVIILLNFVIFGILAFGLLKIFI